MVSTRLPRARGMATRIPKACPRRALSVTTDRMGAWSGRLLATSRVAVKAVADVLKVRVRPSLWRPVRNS